MNEKPVESAVGLPEISAAERSRYADLLHQLIMEIEDPWRNHVAAALLTAMDWIAAGRLLPWNTDALLSCYVLRIAMDHLTAGRPLALPTSVIVSFVQAGKGLETPLFECEDCGYALPRSFGSCPLCRGRVGLGAYAVRRARAAYAN